MKNCLSQTALKQMTDTIYRDSTTSTRRQSKVADSFALDVVVAVPVEGFVGDDVVEDPIGDAAVTGDEVPADFVMDAEITALVAAVAGTVVGCAVLAIPAKLTVTPTLPQSCVAKSLVSKEC